MRFYHMDHSGSLREGQRVVPTAVVFPSVSWPPAAALAVVNTFKEDRLSKFGLRILSPAASPETADTQSFEFLLDYVRYRFFPNLPNRLSCFFGIPDCTSSLEKWKGRFAEDASAFRVFECESDRIYIADASVLDRDSSVHVPSSTPSAPGSAVWKSPFPALRVDIARQYWKSCVQVPDRSPSRPIPQEVYSGVSLPELLVPGPVRILRQVEPS